MNHEDRPTANDPSTEDRRPFSDTVSSGGEHYARTSAASPTCPEGTSGRVGRPLLPAACADGGGQTTISPPPNVKLRDDEPARVLASGIDSLYLAIDVTWADDTAFQMLAMLKADAQAKDEAVPLDLADGKSEWTALRVEPFGAKGYEWLLSGHEMALRIGNWLEPETRPSIMAEIRSETLWHFGARRGVERVREMLTKLGAEDVTIKPSRVDCCVDVLLPAATWTPSLFDHRVTRAVYAAPHFSGRTLTGMSIGKGALCARLYDKPLEIIQKSNKVWMYDIWKLQVVPEGHRIIRVENQLRREPLKQMHVETLADLFDLAPRVWSYCTRSWLKFQHDADKHHTQQETMSWWKIVQDGFAGAQGAEPLVRDRAIRADERQLVQQVHGLLSSLGALYKQGFGVGERREMSVQEVLSRARAKAAELGLDDREFVERADKKFARYQRARVETAAAVVDPFA